MRKILPILVVIIFLFNSPEVSAHPGRTASDGCHYCRTNCDSWGEEWNQRHCHGGSSNLVLPTSAPLPTLTPTSIPTATRASTPTPTPIPTGEVKGESVSPTSISVKGESETKEGDTTAGLVTLGGLGAGGYWLIRKLQKKTKKENLEPPQF